MNSEVVFVIAFLDAVEAFGHSVEVDDGVADARGGDAGGAEHFVADEEGEVAAVLGGVVERPFIHAEEIFLLAEFVHVQRESRLVVDVAEAAEAATEVNADVGEVVRADVDGRFDVFFGIRHERGEGFHCAGGGGDGDVDGGDFIAGGFKECSACRFVLCELRGFLRRCGLGFFVLLFRRRSGWCLPAGGTGREEGCDEWQREEPCFGGDVEFHGMCLVGVKRGTVLKRAKGVQYF